ncbi:MAG: pgk2 [Thermoleophilia bacterium]|nr:pgk2 [Thermoleophilia bacterium]
MTYVIGASGVGTSTRALSLQRELGDSGRPCLLLATDVIRAQLRTVLDQEACPELWGESFNLPTTDEDDEVRSGVNVTAFERQCAPVLRAVEAGVAYALTEGWHVVVEGVHLIPGTFQIPDADQADVTLELLVVADEAEHIARMRSRDVASDGRRPAAHYEANLPRVRTIQAVLVERWDALPPAQQHVTRVGP